MNYTAKGRKFIERHEGLRLCPYKVGEFETYWTIGYGHYGKDVKPGVCITQAAASALLKEDLREDYLPAVREALEGCKNVKQQEVDALLSLAYNLGPGVLLDKGYSTLAKRIDTKEARSFAGRCRIYKAEFPKWVRGGGEVLPGLVQRRKDEVRLACRGKYE